MQYNPAWKDPITTADKIFVALQQAIVEGEIPSGSKISEPELSKKYDISRATLREAINRLESCHLIERTPNVGARVVELSTKGLLEIYQVRESLEGMACRLAAENMSDEDIQAVQNLLEQHSNSQPVKTGESYYQEQGDLDFHFRVILGSKNKHLVNLICGELYHLIRMYRVQLGMNGPRVTRAFAEHTAIINAIADGDGELAEMLMRRHISASRKSIESRFSDQDLNLVAKSDTLTKLNSTKIDSTKQKEA